MNTSIEVNAEKSATEWISVKLITELRSYELFIYSVTKPNYKNLFIKKMFQEVGHRTKSDPIGKEWSLNKEKKTYDKPYKY